MENPLIAAETVRKASLSNLHTQEVTGSSPAVSTKKEETTYVVSSFLHSEDKIRCFPLSSKLPCEKISNTMLSGNGFCKNS